MAPSSSVIVKSDLAFEIAKKYAPRIYQEYGSVFDLLAPIQIGKVADVIKDFAVITTKPTLYFGVRRDDQYWYCFYMPYHPWDVSFSAIRFIRKLDSHRHDTEGLLMRIPRKGGPIDIVTISHYHFLCQKKSNRKVVIESESHAIRPYSHAGPKGNYLIYKSFSFVNLNDFTAEEWSNIRKDLGKGVNLPDTHYDAILRSSASGRRYNKPGDIFKRPDRLCWALKLKGRL